MALLKVAQNMPDSLLALPGKIAEPPSKKS